MKKLLTAYLPALALFALGGCASTSGLASTEDDGVYYSSRDRTTAVMRTAPTTSTNEATNPDYNGNTGTSTARQGSDEYYDNSYTYMQGVRPGVSYYTPYSPYTTLSYGASSYYGDGFGYGGGYGGYSPYGAGFYDPFYSPFYSPYGYGYGSGLTISFGFGRPFGYGSYYGYGRPYGGYGHGYGGFYDPYYYSGYFYGGYYGRGGYYGNNYYGGNNGYYGNNNGYYSDNNGRRNSGGHRDYRSSDGRYQSGNGNAGTVSGNNAGGGRIRPDGLLNPTQGQPTANESRSAAMDNGRSRVESVNSGADTKRDRTSGSFNQPTSISGTDQPRYRNMDQQAAGRQMPDAAPVDQRDTRRGQDMSPQQATRNDSRYRGNRNADAAPQPDQMQPAAAQPQENTRRRGGFFGGGADQPRQEQMQPQQQAPEQSRRNYDQPRQERVYEQPQQQPQRQRSYDQPQQQQRTYEQPRQEQRSYSQPSYSSPSGGGGGSRSGGGGGGGRGRGE